MLEEKIKCVWRKIADNNLELKEQNKNYTLQSSCKCYDCKGYNGNCFDYQPYRRKPGTEAKYKTKQDEFIHGVIN